MALPPSYLHILEAARDLGLDMAPETATAIVAHMEARGLVIVGRWQVDESKRHPGLVWKEERTGA